MLLLLMPPESFFTQLYPFYVDITQLYAFYVDNTMFDFSLNFIPSTQTTHPLAL